MNSLDEFKQDEIHCKAVMEPEEMISTYKVSLPDDGDLVEALWHNVLVYVTKKPS
jgi:hypothetical protein